MLKGKLRWRPVIILFLVAFCVEMGLPRRNGLISGGCGRDCESHSESDCVYVFTLDKGEEDRCPSLMEAAQRLTNQSLSESLLAYYPLDDDSKDYSGNCRHGTMVGIALFSDVEDAVCGKSRFFDGASKIQVDAFNGFNWGEAFSVSVWMKRTGQFGNYQGIVNNGYYTTGSWEIRMGRENGGTMVGGGVVTDDSSKTWDYALYDGVLTQNTWHHIVMSYDGQDGILKYYVDGTAQTGDEDCCSGPIFVRYTPVTIGQAGPGTSKEYFYGFIDEVKLFSRALSPNDVTMLYNEKC